MPPDEVLLMNGIGGDCVPELLETLPSTEKSVSECIDIVVVAVDDGKEQLRQKGFRMESSETEHPS